MIHKKKWLLLGFICAGAILFYQPLLLLGCKVVLKRALPCSEGRTVSYGSMQWENGAIVLSELLVKDSSSEWTADKIEVKFSGDIFRLRFAPQVLVVHPQLSLLSSGPKGAPAFLFYRSRFFQPAWTIKNGVLQLPSSRFYFSMAPGEEQESMGVMHFSHDPLAEPVLSAEVSMKEQRLEVGFKLQESDLSRLLPLFSNISSEWDNASGEVELEGFVFLGQTLEMEELHIRGSGKQIVLADQKRGLQLVCNEASGAFSFPAADGDFILKGALVQERSTLDFNFSGKGGVQEDATLWSEAVLALTTQSGSEMQSLISFCSVEEGAVAIHAKVDNASFEHLDFFRAMLGFEGECVEGSASGSMALLYKEGSWQSLTVENCALNKMRWHFPCQELTVLLGSGHLTGESVFSSPSVHLKVLGEELHFLHPLAEFDVPRLTREAQFSYDAASKEWSCEVPFAESTLRHQDIALQNIDGSLQWEEGKLKGSFNHLNFPVNKTTSMRDASCDVDFDSKTGVLSVGKAEGFWDLVDGTPLTVQIKRMSTQLLGPRTLDFAIRVADGEKELALFEGTATGREIAFDPQPTHFGGVPLNINRLNTASFDMRPVLKCQDVPLLAAWLQNTGFFPLNFSLKELQEWQLEGTLEAGFFSENIEQGFSFQLDSADLKVRGEPWSPFQVRGQKVGEQWQIEKFDAGAFQLKAVFALDNARFASPQFEGSWNGLNLRGSGLLKPDEKCFLCALEIDLPSSLHVTASSRKALQFTYEKDQGIVCSGLDFQLKHKFNNVHLGELRAEKMVLPSSGNLSLQQLQFSLRPVLLGHAIAAKILPDFAEGLQWEGNFEGSGDLQIGKIGPVFLGNLKPGLYGWDGKNLPFEQCQVRYEKKLLSMRAKASIAQQPLWALFQMDLSKEPYGMLKLFDHPKSEGLKVLFRVPDSKIALESIQGSCYGLSCSLAKGIQRNVMTGEILADSDKIYTLLPKNIREGIQNLKLGGGYRWEGDLVFGQEGKKGFSANGILTGKEFELLGYYFQRLEAALDVGTESVLFSNLKIEDPSGEVRVKKIELKKKEDWNLYIPQVLVHELQPSLMRKVGAEPSSLKPFTIKSFTLTDIHCRLGDKASLEGSGYLMFVNSPKKESSILDVPLEMIKKIGLDPGLLTPVQGELQLELRGDKFYLTSLDNSFSEGDRSEFYLLPQKDLSYIDLDGKIHIDLKMRQDVVLKLTEPFTLTIRGTLDKPRYGLQF